MAAPDSKSKTKSYLGGGGGEKKEIYVANPKSQDGIPDLCGLTNLGEGNVVHNLECRYKFPDAKDRCYTSMTAKVLVAVNPYERQNSNYTQDVMRAYQARPMNLEGLVGMDDLPPHVYTVANSAYLNMVAKKQNQSIIVCGESGSGKTESAKYMMTFLAFTTTSTSLDPAEFAEADAIGQQVLDANPILESFGNAKTLINNNSSRFGKFTKMLFADAKGGGAKPRKKLTGACIETYLLEKSRVVYQDKGERNYHIFYQLTHAHNQNPELKLGPPEQFSYLNKSGCTELDDLRYPGKGADLEWYKELMHAFKTLLVAQDQVKSIFQKVAALLHLGNVNFSQRAGEGSDIANPDVMKLSAELFEIDLKGLQNRLETRTMYLPGDKTVIKSLNVEDAIFNRDSMCRNLYNGLFRWIVWRINQQSSKDSEAAGTSWIGILDVFGFEIFENNSFEQFCINFANERLQQYFNHHVLQAEQDLYKREALLWDPIDLPNNQDCIELVTGKPNGILAILDSTCIQPKGDDSVFVANLFNAHKYHPRLRRAKQRKVSGSKQMEAITGFSVRHYAGEVVYNCQNFLSKNSDASEWETTFLFCNSSNDVTNKLLRMKADGGIDEGDVKRSQKRAFLSTGSVFADQLALLMNELQKTAPYFVRCIKPNPNKQPKNFVQDFVRPQLRCGGLIEALRIIKLGFPTRCTYKRIHELFGSILKGKPVTNLNLRDFAESIMNYCGPEGQKLAYGDYQLGLTMVFFRPGKQEYLTQILDKNPDDIAKDKEKMAKIRKWLIRKRWTRGRGTVRALIRCGKMLQEMRFKKAAVAMVIIHRTVGRALREARVSIGGEKEKEEAARRARDIEFQKLQLQQQELVKLQELKKRQDEELARLAKNHEQVLADKDSTIQEQQAKLQESQAKLKDASTKLAETQSKMLALINESKNKQSDLEAKLAAEQSALAESKRQSATQQDKIENYELRLEKSMNANEELKRAMGLGAQEYEKQISEKDRQITDFKDRVRNLEEYKKLVPEKDREIADLKDKVNYLQEFENAAPEKDRLLNEYRDKSRNLESEFSMLKTSSEQKIKDQEQAIEEARDDLRVLREKTTKVIQEKDNELNDVKRDLALAQAKLEASSASASDAEKRANAQLDESQQRYTEMKEKYDREIKKLEAKIADQKAELSIANDRVEAAKRELSASQTTSGEKTSQLERQLKDKEAEANEQREELKRIQSKFEEIQRTLGDKINSLQDDLSKERAKARESSAQNEKDGWEKSNELQLAKSELNMLKDRLRLEKEASEAALKSVQDQLHQERDLSTQRVNKLNSDLQSKSDDLRELKSDFRNEKREWKNKAEKYEKTIAELEAQIDSLQEQAQITHQKHAVLTKDIQQAVLDAEAKAAKMENKYQGQLDDLRGEIKEMEAEVDKARIERIRAVQERDTEREATKEREAKYRDDLAKARADIDRVEREYISYRQQASDEVEQKISALQGQVELLQNLVDELKAEKIEGREREQSLISQLKEAVGQAAESRSQLKALQLSQAGELQKLRLALDSVREKAILDSQQFREQDEALKRKLVEKDTLVTELKAQLQEVILDEQKAKDEARKQIDENKEQTLYLATRNQELESERKNWQSRQLEYERKIGDLQSKVGELTISLSESEHKKAVSDNKAEVEVLKAKLAAAEKALADRSKAFDRQVKLIQDDAKTERDGLEQEYKRQLKHHEEQSRAQNETYKNKLEYLDLKKKSLEDEHKRAVEKEREFEKSLVDLTAELRELRAEYQKQVEFHDSFVASMEAKEAARQAEASNWDIKKKSVEAEYELKLRKKDMKIAQLEAEIVKVKEALDDALHEVDSLSAGIEQANLESKLKLSSAYETGRSLDSNFKTNVPAKEPAVVKSEPAAENYAPPAENDVAAPEAAPPEAAPPAEDAQPPQEAADF